MVCGCGGDVRHCRARRARYNAGMTLRKWSSGPKWRPILIFAGVLAAPLHAFAQAYPSKAVRMIVGFAPGGGTDVAARAIVQPLTDRLGQRVVIDNRPGANGVVGTEIAANSPADGYTLLMVNFIKADMEKWMKLTKELNITAQ